MARSGPSLTEKCPPNACTKLRWLGSAGKCLRLPVLWSCCGWAGRISDVSGCGPEMPCALLARPSFGSQDVPANYWYTMCGKTQNLQWKPGGPGFGSHPLLCIWLKIKWIGEICFLTPSIWLLWQHLEFLEPSLSHAIHGLVSSIFQKLSWHHDRHSAAHFAKLQSGPSTSFRHETPRESGLAKPEVFAGKSRLMDPHCDRLQSPQGN